ncbi:hypothetical protein JCM8202_004546 [Rhodotorula sphaerocarpa]
MRCFALALLALGALVPAVLGALVREPCTLANLEPARRKALRDRLHNKQRPHHAKHRVEPVLVPSPAGAAVRPAEAHGAVVAEATCPRGLSACATGDRAGFECIDLASNLYQCGGCYGQGGTDCSTIPGADAVGCIAGRCESWSCQEGFSINSSGTACGPTVSMASSSLN